MAAPKLKFLIVDPLEGVQVFSRRLLEGYGFDPALIRCCADPEAALALAREQVPDFLITEWFPKGPVTGVQLYEQVRALHPACRVGFTSFVIDETITDAARAAGSRFVQKKPFDADDLKRTLQSAFEALSREMPELMARVSQETRGRLDPRVARQIQLPPVPPPIKVGDAVRYEGKPHKVIAVVIRQGEQVAQLDGGALLVPAHKLQR
jgi:DNA-binding NarL/FixJ family response regulator